MKQYVIIGNGVARCPAVSRASAAQTRTGPSPWCPQSGIRLLPAADFLLSGGKDRHRAHAVPRRRLLRAKRLSGAVRQIGGPSGRGGKDGGAGRRHNPALRFDLRRRRFLALPAAAGGLGDGRKGIHLYDARRRTGAGGGGEGRFPRADCRRGADRAQMRRGTL